MKKTYVFNYGADRKLKQVDYKEDSIAPDASADSLSVVTSTPTEGSKVWVVASTFTDAVKLVNATLNDTSWSLGDLLDAPKENKKTSPASYANQQAMARARLEELCNHNVHLGDSKGVNVPMGLIRFIRDSFDIIREATWQDPE
jgi:hypothetical protein